MERTLAQAAAQLGLTRPKLIALMREKGLLKGNLPADPTLAHSLLSEYSTPHFHLMVVDLI